MTTKLPFLYFGHGYTSTPEHLECYIWFERDLLPQERSIIERTAPKPLTYFFNWDKNVLHFGSDNLLGLQVRQNYNSEIFEILQSGDKMRIDQYCKDVEGDKYGSVFYPTDTEWKNFDNAINDWINTIHDYFPISFFIKPQVEQTDKPLSQWHHQSVQQIGNAIIPQILTAFQTKPAPSHAQKISRIINLLLQLQHKNKVKTSILEKQQFIELLELSIGYTPNYDKYNAGYLGDFLMELPSNVRDIIFNTLAPLTKLNLFASSYKHLHYFLIAHNNDRAKYFEQLLKDIPITQIEGLGYLLLTIAKKIGGLSYPRTIQQLNDKTAYKIARILETAFVYPDCPMEAFIITQRIYAQLELWENCIETCQKGISIYENNGAFIAGIFNAASHIGREDVIVEYLDFAMDMPDFMSDSYMLSNIIYALNRNGQKEAALKLTKSYRSANLPMIPSLYTNMTDSYLLNNEIDAILENLLQEVENQIYKEELFFGPILFENLACIYAYKGEANKSLDYLKEAKTRKHPNFRALHKLQCFNPMRNNPEFVALFGERRR